MDKLIKYSTVISSVVIFLGYLKLKFFYDHFNIRINDFLELSEILTSFLNDLNVMGIIFLALLTHVSLSMLMNHYLYNYNRKNKVSVDVVLRYLGKNVFKSRTLILLFVLYSIWLFLVFYFYNSLNFYVSTYLIVIFLLQCSLLVIDEFLKFDTYLDFQFISARGLSIIIVLVTISYLLAEKEYNQVSSKDYSGHIIETNNKKIIFNKNELFIGKTKNYLFLKKCNRIKIINVSEIKSFIKPIN